MFALCITLVALLMATAQAGTSDINPRNPTLPQCGNLTLSWPDGKAPFTIQVIDLADGKSVTLHTHAHHVVWTINASLNAEVSFLVTDRNNASTSGGPYKVTYTGVTSCLYHQPMPRDKEMPRNAESLPKRAEIMLTPISERGILNDRRNSPSNKRAHRKRGIRRAPTSGGP